MLKSDDAVSLRKCLYQTYTCGVVAYNILRALIIIYVVLLIFVMHNQLDPEQIQKMQVPDPVTTGIILTVQLLLDTLIRVYFILMLKSYWLEGKEEEEEEVEMEHQAYQVS